MAEIKSNPVSEQEQDADTLIGLPFKVILFNDDWHSFDEVISQLMKAVHCSFEKARDYAFEVHTKGQSCVYVGELQNCLKVSSILEEIALHTQVVA
jgi:ATP-dependent Clp protease adaptor protein ClpS